MLNFIDISSWQKGLDLKKLFEQNPLDGVIVKATGGASYVQPTCDPWVQTLITLGKPWGFYHFMDDDGIGSSGKVEAEHFVKHCENYFGHGMPWADFEATAETFGTGYLLEFLETVEELTGYRCGVYCNLNAVQTNDFSAIAEKGYPLWVAQYANMKPATFETEPWQKGSIAPFERYVMHQYSCMGRLNGWSEYLDLDKFYGTVEEWQKMIRGDEKSKEPLSLPVLDLRERLLSVANEIISIADALGRM